MLPTIFFKQTWNTPSSTPYAVLFNYIQLSKGQRSDHVVVTCFFNVKYGDAIIHWSRLTMDTSSHQRATEPQRHTMESNFPPMQTIFSPKTGKFVSNLYFPVVFLFVHALHMDTFYVNSSIKPNLPDRPPRGDEGRRQHIRHADTQHGGPLEVHA